MSEPTHVPKPLPKFIDMLVLPLFSILLSFVLAALIVLAIGESPYDAFYSLFNGVFGYSKGLGYALYYTTNFIFAGLAATVAFNAMMFNIGIEGQAYIGGLGVAVVMLALDSVLPGPLVAILGILGAIAFGALWVLIPAYLRAKRESNETITTIMFNFIANAIMLYIIVEFMAVPGMGNTESREFAESTWLPFVYEMAAWVGLKVEESPLNLSFFLALLTAFGVWIYIYKTRWGFALRTLGKSETVATYAGINTKRTIMIALCASGGLAGMVAINAIMGVSHKLILGFVAGSGFVGLAISIIGRNHPLGVVLVSLLFGFLYQGGTEMSFDNQKISKEIIVVIQGMIILFAGALPLMFKPMFVKLWNVYCRYAH